MSQWDAHVAREAHHQARIETAFDRADASGRVGDLERALVWLAEAENLAGGLSAEYIAQREHWTRSLHPIFGIRLAGGR